MLETGFTTIMSYIGTNIDDIFIDTIFFSQVNTKREIRAVILGKYLGIGALVIPQTKNDTLKTENVIP